MGECTPLYFDPKCSRIAQCFLLIFEIFEQILAPPQDLLDETSNTAPNKNTIAALNYFDLQILSLSYLMVSEEVRKRYT